MLPNFKNSIRRKVSRHSGLKLNTIRLAFFGVLLFCGTSIGLIFFNQNSLALAQSPTLYQAVGITAATITPQPSPTPAPTPTPQPSPTPVPGSTNQTTTDKSGGPIAILVFFGIFVVGSLLAVFVSTRRIGRGR